MVTTIVIPQDPTGPLRVQELASVGDFQEVTGGFLEPYELTALGITFWVNEAAHREHGVLNPRATALHWYYSSSLDYPHLILGDVVISGSAEKGGGADVPEHIFRSLLTPHCYVVQVSPNDDEHWNNTFARFDNIYDAALWCMLLARSFRPGPAFRMLALTPSGARHLMQEQGLW